MIIAFSFLTNDEENGNCILEIFDKITKSHLEHTFLFISDKPFQEAFVFSKNVVPVVINYEAKSPMKWLIWHNIKIPKVLKKYKADIFISERFCSLITKVPQILIAPNLTYIHQPTYVNKKQKLFYKKFTPRFLKKAKTIIAYSEYAKADIIKQFKINTHKIQVTDSGTYENCKPINIEERENIKEKYADGNEYFIYSGIISPQKNLMNLLKGFSAFKKRQRSSMQLIIAGQPGKKYKEFIESLSLYRFNKEVKLLDNLSPKEIVKIIASAYAMIYPVLYETTANSLMEAMKCAVPVITSSTGAIPDICGEAALFFDPENPKDIAEKMMLIFKDEELRKELIEKGNILGERYDWEKSADVLWRNIEKNLITP